MRSGKNVLIDRILGIELDMFLSVRAREQSGCQGRPETYLRGELESYSDETLTLLHEDTRRRFDEGVNIVEGGVHIPREGDGVFLAR